MTIEQQARRLAMRQFLNLEDDNPEELYQMLKDNPMGYAVADVALLDRRSSVRKFGSFRTPVPIEELVRRIDELTADIVELWMCQEVA